ncbi:uncharacterized protein I206_100876 [Kwoniella pini CBS 10737]|uniref:Uncharacterized protein n=1 Tax=Kwoniella pini CBS 10737 TaxID=1296096 RepID=A0A1B9IC17_9TREE|nr:uncharacterized protein I206_00450 [Kwoniella pini CBS 10737]OCF53149.1 hypothetical protein I206_00450 [Kwoniella pini CBS 10737]
MTCPLRPPFRNRSQTQSHLSYKALPHFTPIISAGWRGGETQKRWFLLVQYGKEFLIDGRTRVDCDEDEEGGSLLVALQLIAHQQVIHLLSQLQLPSPLGLSLHLVLAEGGHNPKLTYSIWPSFFSSYFLVHSSSHAQGLNGCLPIAANVVLKLDQRKARWFDGWKRDHQDGLISKWVNISRPLTASRSLEERCFDDTRPTVTKEEHDPDLNQFTDSPYDPTLTFAKIRENPLETTAPNNQQSQTDEMAEQAVRESEEISIHQKHDIDNIPQANQDPLTITLPPLSAFPTLDNHINSSRSSTPLSFHSIPYSPIHTLPDPEALITQPFLRELYQNISITRAKYNSDLAIRRGKRRLTIETHKQVRPPWADLSSTMWSAGTSWGPPTTPEGWDLTPTSRERLKLSKIGKSKREAAHLEISRKEMFHQDSIDFSRSPTISCSAVSPRGAMPYTLSSTEYSVEQPDPHEDHCHSACTFLPKGPVIPTP